MSEKTYLNTKKTQSVADARTLENSALVVATFTSFMGPFMISAVNVALPAIQKEFSADAVLLSWVATSYLLATAVFLVPMGKVADLHGRKKIFAWGLVVFVFSSFFTAFVRSIGMLIVLRVIQGLGAAMVVTTGMAILTSVFPLSRRGRAIGIYVAAVYVGLSVGPFAGGALTHHFTWRSIFVAILPFGLISICVTASKLKGEWVGATEEGFDSVGTLLYGFAILTLVYGASQLPDKVAYGFVVLGLLALVAFIRQEARVKHPVFEIRLFQTNKLFAFSSLAALINYAATFAVTFLLSLYLQYVKGMNPQQAGLILVAQPIVQAVFSPLAGKLSDRIEPRFIASAGMTLTVLGLFQLTLIGQNTSAFYITGILVMLGLGFALFSSPNMNAIMSSVEKRYYGIASGAVATMRLLGQMFSMAIATVVFAILLGRAQISPSNLNLFIQSVKASFIIFSSLCTAGIFFSLYRGRLRN